MNEDVFPIEHGRFPASHVSELRGVSVRYRLFYLKKSVINTYPEDP